VSTDVDCEHCDSRLRIPEALWEQRFAGRVRSIKCKVCSGRIKVDGRLADPGAAQTPAVLDAASAPIRSLGESPVEPQQAAPKPASTTVSKGPLPPMPKPPAVSAAAKPPSPAPPRTEGSSSEPPQDTPAPGPPPLATAIEFEPAQRDTPPQPPRAAAVHLDLWVADLDVASPLPQSRGPSPIVPPRDAMDLPEPDTLARSSWSCVTQMDAIAAPAAKSDPEPDARRRSDLPHSTTPGPVFERVKQRSSGSRPGAPPRALQVSARRFRILAGAGLGVAAAGALLWLTQSAEPAPIATSHPGTPSAEPIAAPSTPAAPKAAALQTTSIPQPRKQSVKSAPAPRYDSATVDKVLKRLVDDAEKCHQGGRVSGSATLELTFRPSGRVANARVIGEPIASAPVSRCILAKARAAKIPEFQGEHFNVSRSLTLN
jgi:hypothetical protein